MKRLTIKRAGDGFRCNQLDKTCVGYDCDIYKHHDRQMDKLGYYEDLEEKLNGISLDTIVDMLIKCTEDKNNETYSKGRILTNEHAEKWLRWLELQEQGRLIEFPCNVGDTVWCITSDQHDCILYPIECTVISIEIDYFEKEWKFRIDSKHRTYGWTTTFPDTFLPTHMNLRTLNDFGKTVFLTLEEAQAKLEEMGK